MESDQIWRGNFCMEISPAPGVVTIFGGAGDLAIRKLFPALYRLMCAGLLHENTILLGCGRHEFDDISFRKMLQEALKDFACSECGQLDEFLEHVGYWKLAYDNPQDFYCRKQQLHALEVSDGPYPSNHIFYLATPASLYGTIIPHLAGAGLLEESPEGLPFRHVVLEKPFGHDIVSAEALDRELHQYLSERQIYRIDHYLGKETVQNILMLRFANRIFEPIWNADHIEKVEITVAEDIGIGKRAGYFEGAGLLRDMFQNHMLEMLSLVAMEPPVSFAADDVRDEKLKVIRSIRPFTAERIQMDFVRGQYIAGNGFSGYRDEAGVAPDSTVETYVGCRMWIDNWRWKNVPFYLRSGKMLAAKRSEIAITFRKIPHSIFAPIQEDDLTQDLLVLQVQPEEGMALTIQAKQPGPKLCMGALTLQFQYGGSSNAAAVGRDAYERLLLDILLGDQTLFIRSDIIAASWKLFMPILEAWKNSDSSSLQFYPAGSQGPEAANDLTEWRSLI